MGLSSKILKVIEDVVLEPVPETADLHRLGDAVRFHEILMAVEDANDVELTDRDMAQIDTPADLIRVVGEKLGQPPT